jgi:hypothetical protein
MLHSKGMKAKGKYADFEEAITPLAEDKSPQFLNMIPQLANYDNAGDMLYKMGKDPMVLGALKGASDSPTGLKRALDKYSKQVEEEKEPRAAASSPIESPQTGHGVAGSMNRAPSVAEAKEMYKNYTKR